MTPAFKEWSTIVNGLSVGDQTLILRKGGISEDRGGFDVKADPFWLLPTKFHAQAEKLKPSVHLVPPDSSTPEVIQLTAFAKLHAHHFLTCWPDVMALSSLHHWTDTTIRERSEWSRPAGIHLLLVRIYRLNSLISFPLTSAQSGCKSWVSIPICPSGSPSPPALDDTAFEQQIAQIQISLQTLP
ncbi:MAG: DUF1802 family protein [Candidatus Synoicihabitans palmerolidicus]|nr:DUF1802 family protein [Candidatus Synoicihabitans palmerolidicus]